jgi:hypothetical protein
MKRTNDIYEFINQSGDFGDRRVFGFEGEYLEDYLMWSKFFDYLFVDSDENGITGLGIAFPIKNKFNKEEDWFFTFNAVPEKKEEENCDLCIMDLVAINKTSRNNIIESFKKRYPKWETQKKYALIRGEPKEVTNKHINLLQKHGQ